MAQINLLTNKNIVDPKNEEYYNALSTILAIYFTL